jgi:hypothetical protein
MLEVVAPDPLTSECWLTIDSLERLVMVSLLVLP